MESKMGFSLNQVSFWLKPQNKSLTETKATGNFPTETRVTKPA